MPKGLFITLEGGEGAGKSTQAKRLTEYLQSNGHEVLATREPGGCEGALQIRQLLVTGEVDRWSPTAEALLNYAARDSHLRQSIRPALEAGKIVVCDRFMDSTTAYQGAGGKVDSSFLTCLADHVVANTIPDLTIIFDIDAETGLGRTRGRDHGSEDRYEKKAIEYHQTLRQAFLDIAKAEPERCVVIDAATEQEAVFDQIISAVKNRLKLP